MALCRALSLDTAKKISAHLLENGHRNTYATEQDIVHCEKYVDADK